MARHRSAKNTPQAPICLAPLLPGKRIFFCSDLHLAPALDEREKRILQWLDSIEQDAAALFLVGDIFDFWCEYAHVVPKALLRFQARLLSFVEKGIPVHLFAGNHDLWLSAYFEKELGVHLYRYGQSFVLGDRRFFVSHGDAHMSNGWIKRALRLIYGHSLCRRVFTWLHPDWSIPLVRTFSSWLKGPLSTFSNTRANATLMAFCVEKDLKDPHHGYIFGHTHVPQILRLSAEATFLNLGDWVHHGTYAVFDGQDFALKRFDAKAHVLCGSNTLSRSSGATPRALASVP